MAATARKQRAAAKQRAKQRRLRTSAGSRYLVHYDIDGPRVRLGVAWFLAAVGCFLAGLAGVAVFFAGAFGAAASHTARAWRARKAPIDPRVALTATAVVVVSAWFGPQVMGVALLAAVAVVVAVAAGELGDDEAPAQALGRASLSLQAMVPNAVAGGCIVLLAAYESWAAVSLIVLCSAYETGDFLVGSGAPNPIEGPLAGGAAVIVVGVGLAVVGLLPLEIGETIFFAVVAVPCAVVGQLLGSVLLPHSRALAPALRRVDSYLLTAPVWYFGITALAR